MRTRTIKGVVLIIALTAIIAMSVSGGSFYFFPELRFQFGIDP